MTKVCAMATNANTTPLFETEVKTLVARPFACWDANRMNITANTRKLSKGPALRFQNRLRDCEADVVGGAISARAGAVRSSDRVGLASEARSTGFASSSAKASKDKSSFAKA